jgi:hypothetical protein
MTRNNARIITKYLREAGWSEVTALRQELAASKAFGNGRERLMSRLRSAVSPLVDCRNEFDKARDRIAELAE